MSIVYTNTGEPYVINNMDDLANMLYNIAGEDVYYIFTKYVRTHTREYLKSHSDLDNYEASLESNARAFSDIKDTLSPMKNYLENTPRMDRQQLLRATNHMLTIIDSQI